MAGVLYLAALVVFVLGAVGYTPGNMSPEQTTDLGLALLVAGMVIAPIVNYARSHAE